MYAEGLDLLVSGKRVAAYKNFKSIKYGSGTIPPNRFGLKPPPKKKGKQIRGK